MGYINPLLKLPAGQALLELPAEDRARIEAVLRELRAQADAEAENSWLRRKGPMAAYWRAVSTYARHLAHALSRTPNHNPSPNYSSPPTCAGMESYCHAEPRHQQNNRACPGAHLAGQRSRPD